MSLNFSLFSGKLLVAWHSRQSNNWFDTQAIFLRMFPSITVAIAAFLFEDLGGLSTWPFAA
jgi:hypothetical protein